MIKNSMNIPLNQPIEDLTIDTVRYIKFNSNLNVYFLIAMTVPLDKVCVLKNMHVVLYFKPINCTTKGQNWWPITKVSCSTGSDTF